jgi:hypothetical protein
MGLANISIFTMTNPGCRSKKLFLTLAVHLALSLPAEAVSERWELINRKDNLTMWKFKEIPLLRIAVQKFERKGESRNFKGLSRDQIFKSVEKEKKIVLDMMGLRDWKVTDYKIVQDARLEKIVMTGTYKNGNSELIAFCEIHIFTNATEVQSLLTQPVKNEKESLNSAALAEFLKDNFE